jgi:hypothetical protein
MAVLRMLVEIRPGPVHGLPTALNGQDVVDGADGCAA